MKKTFFLILICFLINFSFITYSFSTIVENPNDDFSSLPNTTLWIETIPNNPGTFEATRDIENGRYKVETPVYPGGVVELKTNYYLVGDFTATIEVQPYYTNWVTSGFNFFKDLGSGETYTCPPTGTTNHRELWGFSGGKSYSFVSDNGSGNRSFLYTESNPNVSNYYISPSGQSFQMKIERIDDDVYTYYTNTSSNWILQNYYQDFGTDPLVLSYVAGDGSGSDGATIYADNFSVTGFTVYGKEDAYITSDIYYAGKSFSESWNAIEIDSLKNLYDLGKNEGDPEEILIDGTRWYYTEADFSSQGKTLGDAWIDGLGYKNIYIGSGLTTNPALSISAIPEPSSIILMGFGIAGLIRKRIKK